MPSSTRQSVSARTGLPKRERERDTHLVIKVAYDSVIAEGHLGLVCFPDGAEEKRERATQRHFWKRKKKRNEGELLAAE